MSFINLLRGGVDTAAGARAAGQRTDMQTLPFLVQLQQMQNAQQRQQTMDAANLAHIGAETRHLNEPPKPAEDERFQSRVHALQATGMDLDTANTQAAKEFGKTPYLSPLDIHKGNVAFDREHPAPVTEPYAPAPTIDPVSGVTTTGSFDKRTGKVVPGTVPKPIGSGGFGGSQAPVGDMEQRYNEIEAYAKDIAAGKVHPTRTMQTREGLGYGIANQSAGGQGVPLTQSIAAGAMDMLGMGEGPEYKRYQALMNSTRAFGDDAAKVFKGRQNEEAVKREIANSELTPDDYQNPAVIQQKLSRLREIINLAKSTMPAAANPAPTTHPVPHANAPATGSDILSKYGIKPTVP